MYVLLFLFLQITSICDDEVCPDSCQEDNEKEEVINNVWKITLFGRFKQHLYKFCKHSFSNAHKLQCHYISVHCFVDKLYQCKNCDNRYATRGVLNSLIIDKHSKIINSSARNI